MLQQRFGKIPGITDKSYITNSYHVHVTEPIDAFTKLAFEAQFQRLSPGGAISYVEVPNMQNNIDAVLEVMQFIYDNIMYAELNTKSDYCKSAALTGRLRFRRTPTGSWSGPASMREPGSEQDERGSPDLRLHRNPVLEPRPDAGNPGPGASSVMCSVTIVLPEPEDGDGCKIDFSEILPNILAGET